MKSIINGFRKFKREVFPAHLGLYRSLSKGQNPKALFITCSDSRVVPEIITQSQPGDLFICRTVGNQVPPHGDSAGHSVASSIEYAVMVLGIREIVICGHTDCGAMHGVLHPGKLSGLPSTAAWLQHTDRARAAVLAHRSASHTDSELVGHLAEENVISQLTHLKTHPSVAERLEAGDLDIYGWVYQLDSGDIRTYDTTSTRFIPLLETYGAPPSRRMKTALAGSR